MVAGTIEGFVSPAPIPRPADDRPDLARLPWLADAAARVCTAVERNDARLVDHFVRDHHVPRRLHDLIAGVVDGRRQRADHAARDAAVVEPHVQPAAKRPQRVRVGADAAWGARAVARTPDDALPEGILDEHCRHIYDPEGELRASHLIDTNSGNVARGIFQGFRSPKGEDLVLKRNLFIEGVLPSSILRKLTDEEMSAYRAPFAKEERVSRRAQRADRRSLLLGVADQREVAVAELDRPARHLRPGRGNRRRPDRRRRRIGAVLGVLAALAVLAGVLFLSPALAVRDMANDPKRPRWTEAPKAAP